MSDDELKNPTGAGAGDATGAGSSGDHQNVPAASGDSAAPTAHDDLSDTCDVAGAALGALAQSEDAAVYAAASTDPRVSAELAAMESVAAELAMLAPTLPMNRGRSAGIRSRLVARAAATRIGRAAPRVAASEPDSTAARPLRQPPQTQHRPSQHRPPQHRPPHPRDASNGPSSARPTPVHVVPFEPRMRPDMGRFTGALALAAVLLIAAFGIYSWRSRSATGAGASVAANDSSLNAQIAGLEASVARKDSLIAMLTGMNTRVIEMVSYATADPMARVFWDQKTQMFVMYASHLKQPAGGKTYQMWLIARGGRSPVSVGTFMPDAEGSVIMAVKHPVDPGMLRRVAVTEEPNGGMPSPTGPVLFTGTIR